MFLFFYFALFGCPSVYWPVCLRGSFSTYDEKKNTVQPVYCSFLSKRLKVTSV